MSRNGIIIYSHYGCLGHSTRVFSIAQELKFDCLCYSPPQEFIDYHQLPFQHYFVSQPTLGKETFFSSKYLIYFSRDRIKEVLRILATYKYIIFEYFPFGRFQLAKEYRYLITALKRMEKIIISSVGYPILNPNRMPLVLEMIKDFDQIWFHCDLEEIKFWQEINPRLPQFLTSISSKSHFTGYLKPYSLPLIPQDPLPPLDSGYILTMRGSGIVLERLISSIMEIAQEMTQERFVILLGPSSQTTKFLSVPSNVIVIRQTNQIEDLIKKSKLVISSASYNSCLHLISHPKPTILVPFTGTETYSGLNEQPIRSKFLSSVLTPCEIIEDKKLSPIILKEAIQKILLKKGSQPTLSFCPQFATGEGLKKLLSI